MEAAVFKQISELGLVDEVTEKTGTIPRGSDNSSQRVVGGFRLPKSDVNTTNETPGI